MSIGLLQAARLLHRCGVSTMHAIAASINQSTRQHQLYVDSTTTPARSPRYGGQLLEHRGQMMGAALVIEDLVLGIEHHNDTVVGMQSTSTIEWHTRLLIG